MLVSANSLLATPADSKLDALGRSHNCDKSSVNRSKEQGKKPSPGHDYLRKYEMFIKGYVNDPDFAMLELGAGPDWNIGASLRIWKDYFSQAKEIRIADIKNSALELQSLGDNIHVVIGDLGRDDVLNSLQGAYDFVIDDASHIWSHQIKAFNSLFPSVKPGGVYIIEDIHTSFGKFRETYSKSGGARICNVDAFSYFSLMSAYLTGDFLAHPFFSSMPSIIGINLYNIEDMNLLQQSCINFARQIASISFIKHSCIIIKDKV